MQIRDSAANMTTSFPDPSPLTAMTIGLLGLDQLHSPLRKGAFRQIHEILLSIRESHSIQNSKRRRLCTTNHTNHANRKRKDSRFEILKIKNESESESESEDRVAASVWQAATPRLPWPYDLGRFKPAESLVTGSVRSPGGRDEWQGL